MDKYGNPEGLSEREWAREAARWKASPFGFGEDIPCAHCGSSTRDAWVITQPKVYVLCGAPGCEQWAWSQNLTIRTTSALWTSGTRAAPSRPTEPAIRRQRDPRVCASCHGPLPRLRKDRFRDGQKQYCTLTCLEQARRV